MWEIDAICSDPECGEDELRVWTDDLEDLEALPCPCGHSVVVLRVAAYEPQLPILLTRTAKRRRALTTA